MNQWVDMKPQQRSDNICTFRKTSGIEKVKVSTKFPFVGRYVGKEGKGKYQL